MMGAVHLFTRDATADDEAVLRQEAVDAAHRALTYGVDGLRNFPVFLAEIFERRVWENDRVFPGGTRQGPIAFREFVHQPYPVGLGSTFESVEKLIRSDVKLVAAWTEVTKREPGRPEKAETETVDNIHGLDERPTGTSKEAGLRKLQKAAAEGNEVAQAALTEAVEGRKSVHSACVDAGLRKPTKLDADVRDRCSKSVAEWIVARLGQDDPSPIVSDLFALGGGAKHIAIEIKNLVGESSTMDRAGWR